MSDNPHNYTQFLEHYRRKYANLRGSFELEHDSGKKMFADYTGKKLEIVNRSK